MIRFTTPTLKLKIKNYIMPDSCDVYVTIRQGSVALTKTDMDIYVEGDDTFIEVALTQEETKSFGCFDEAFVQVNWITSEGVRNATSIAQINVYNNLLDEVKHYGD